MNVDLASLFLGTVFYLLNEIHIGWSFVYFHVFCILMLVKNVLRSLDQHRVLFHLGRLVVTWIAQLVLPHILAFKLVSELIKLLAPLFLEVLGKFDKLGICYSLFILQRYILAIHLFPLFG